MQDLHPQTESTCGNRSMPVAGRAAPRARVKCTTQTIRLHKSRLLCERGGQELLEDVSEWPATSCIKHSVGELFG